MGEGGEKNEDCIKGKLYMSDVERDGEGAGKKWETKGGIWHLSKQVAALGLTRVPG